MENNYYPFINLPLPYSYNALEPFIDQKTMYLHHDKHLQTYINNLNNVLKERPHLQKLSLEQLVKTSSGLSPDVQTPIKNNAGGVYNHRFFFDSLINPSEILHPSKLLDTINRQFASIDNFKAQFKQAALSVFGSGYAWLTYNRNRLLIITTHNQNSPIAQGLCPLLTIDVWEHAYYLKHYNVRADYINDWFSVINWEKVEQNYLNCQSAQPRLI